MWLGSDNEEFMNKQSVVPNSIWHWVVETIKAAAATSTAVILSAAIVRLQSYIVNVGVPQHQRLSVNAPGVSAPCTPTPSYRRPTWYDDTPRATQSIIPY